MSEHEGDLRYIERVVSSEVVMPPFSRKLIESLATRYAGVTSDVIRLAIPPRHAKAEESDTSTPWEELGTATEPDLSIWSGYVHGQIFVDAVIGGSTDDVHDKDRILAVTLRALGEPDPASVIMVGDRASDLAAAAVCGVRGVGVSWGYGSRAELEAARPEQLIDTPDELPALL